MKRINSDVLVSKMDQLIENCSIHELQVLVYAYKEMAELGLIEVTPDECSKADENEILENLRREDDFLGAMRFVQLYNYKESEGLSYVLKLNDENLKYLADTISLNKREMASSISGVCDDPDDLVEMILANLDTVLSQKLNK